jgi:hypothetical protein
MLKDQNNQKEEQARIEEVFRSLKLKRNNVVNRIEDIKNQTKEFAVEVDKFIILNKASKKIEEM